MLRSRNVKRTVLLLNLLIWNKKLKKFLLIFICLNASFSLLAQSTDYIYDSITRTEKYLYKNGNVQCEIKQLDKVPDKHRHIIYYSITGQKTREFYDRNRMVYDTLKMWTDEGKLYHIEAYTSAGYTSIDYWIETGKISEYGKYEISKTTSNMVVYDSATFDKYTVKNCGLDETCYTRTGVWKKYHKNGALASEGKYLPWAFSVSIPARDSMGVSVPFENMSFDILPETNYMMFKSFLKDGTWNYYDEKGTLIRKEAYKNGLLVKKK